jgi:hypothetical protein
MWSEAGSPDEFVKISPKNNQGDQIGRIFAHWAIVFFGQIFENCRSSANSLAMYFLQVMYHF